MALCTRALAGWAVRQPGAAVGRQHRHRGRTLHPRLRSCIPRQQVVASYAPVMPSFTGVIGEDDLVKLVAYIESLGRSRQP